MGWPIAGVAAICRAHPPTPAHNGQHSPSFELKKRSFLYVVTTNITLGKPRDCLLPRTSFPLIRWGPGGVSASLSICPSCPSRVNTAVRDELHIIMQGEYSCPNALPLVRFTITFTRRRGARIFPRPCLLEHVEGVLGGGNWNASASIA